MSSSVSTCSSQSTPSRCAISMPTAACGKWTRVRQQGLSMVRAAGAQSTATPGQQRQTGWAQRLAFTLHVEALQHKQLVVAGLVEKGGEPGLLPDPAARANTTKWMIHSLHGAVPLWLASGTMAA